MAEANNNSFNDQPVLIEDNSMAQIARNVIIGVVIVIIAVVAAVYYWNQKQNTEQAASAALANAKGAEQLQKVAEQYPGTAAGASALLLVAASHQDKQDFATAAELYSHYLKNHPKTPFSAAAEFAKAQCLDAAGKKGEAQAEYVTILNSKPASPYAGGAAIALAKIYESENNPGAAKQTLTDFLSRDLNSSFQVEAGRMLSELPQDPKK